MWAPTPHIKRKAPATNQIVCHSCSLKFSPSNAATLSTGALVVPRIPSFVGSPTFIRAATPPILLSSFLAEWEIAENSYASGYNLRSVKCAKEMNVQKADWKEEE